MSRSNKSTNQPINHHDQIHTDATSNSALLSVPSTISSRPIQPTSPSYSSSSPSIHVSPSLQSNALILSSDSRRFFSLSCSRSSSYFRCRWWSDSFSVRREEERDVGSLVRRLVRVRDWGCILVVALGVRWSGIVGVDGDVEVEVGVVNLAGESVRV